MPLTSEEQVVAAAAKAASLTAEIKRLEANRAKFMLECAAMLDKELHTARAKLAELTADLERWAIAFRSDRFANGKTFSAGPHKLAFRNTPAKVGTAPGLSEEDALQTLVQMMSAGRAADATPEERELGTRAAQFLRLSFELNKPAIVGGFQAAETKEFLRSLGFTVESGEVFAFTPSIPKPAPLNPAAEGNTQEGTEA